VEKNNLKKEFTMQYTEGEKNDAPEESKSGKIERTSRVDVVRKHNNKGIIENLSLGCEA
jgi:hypothetical protein